MWKGTPGHLNTKCLPISCQVRGLRNLYNKAVGYAVLVITVKQNAVCVFRYLFS